MATCDPWDAFPLADRGMQLCLVTWYSAASLGLGSKEHSVGVPERQKPKIRVWRNKLLNFSSLCGWSEEDHDYTLTACPIFLSFTNPVRRGPGAVLCFWKFPGRWKIRWKFSLAFWARLAGSSVSGEDLCLCQQDRSAESSVQIQLCSMAWLRAALLSD